MADRVIQSVGFDPDSVSIAYIDDSDVRDEMRVWQTHQISVARGGGLTEETLALEEAAADLLGAALARWHQTPPVDINAQLLRQQEEDSDANER